MPSKAQSKDRITITVRKDLLATLDNFIDGEKIRNRSHAVEYILSQHLGLGISTAVILAGSDADGNVHALTRVRNRPVIAYTIDMLKENGIRNVIILIDDEGTELEKYIGDGKQWGVKATYVKGKPSKGTAHALSQIASMLDETFILIYGDVLIDVNLNDFLEYHQQAEGLMTMALTYKHKLGEYGVARMEGNKILEYEERPDPESLHGLVNAGLYLIEPKVFGYLEKTEGSFETSLLPVLAERKKLIGYPFQGKWFNISTKRHQDRAQTEWR